MVYALSNLPAHHHTQWGGAQEAPPRSLTQNEKNGSEGSTGLKVRLPPAGGFQFEGPFFAQPNWNDPKNTKAAVNQTPPKWNATNSAEEKGVGNHQRASDDAEREKPAIADRIAQRAYKSDRYRKITECHPVGAIKQEW